MGEVGAIIGGGGGLLLYFRGRGCYNFVVVGGPIIRKTVPG